MVTNTSSRYAASGKSVEFYWVETEKYPGYWLARMFDARKLAFEFISKDRSEVDAQADKFLAPEPKPAFSAEW